MGNLYCWPYLALSCWKDFQTGFQTSLHAQLGHLLPSKVVEQVTTVLLAESSGIAPSTQATFHMMPSIMAKFTVLDK